MTRLATIHRHLRQAMRLVTLLLVMMVAVSSLTSHAATDAGPIECTAVAQLQHDAGGEEHHCPTAAPCRHGYS
ncbi:MULTISPECIES: hypothetical protein [Halomonadaceae]|uniref:hypothetical protein n=1 Tax=Halomonadaceae TaxID=28256 RepID=UPI00159A91AB|nr:MULTISPECIES: hypothetical protein [Halomonas]QJQ96116.1 hypothetical protein HIO72_13135 [Halomonas sp. PA5]